MGGTVAVTLRMEDGTEHRMARWTNIFPEEVHNLGFISGSLEYWTESLERFYGMKRDWDDNKEEFERRLAERPDDWEYREEIFKFPMTTCYAPCTYLAPEGYGLIVLDQVEKKILDMQGYTSFGKALPGSVAMAMDWNVGKSISEGQTPLKPYIEQLRTKPDENPVVEFYDLCEAGKITGREEYDPSINGFKVIDLRGVSTEEIFNRYILGSRGIDRLILDLSPYTVERFDEDSEGAIKMRERVLELGFVLSEEEKGFWQEWINDQLEQETEDDGF